MQKSIEEIIESYPGKSRENLLSILQDIQKEFGFLPEKSMDIISNHINLPTSKIYGIATFYDKFSFEQLGKFHIKVCVGTGCHLAGSERIIGELEKLLNISVGETTKDLNYSLETVPCMGACGLAPVLEINGKYFTGIKIGDIGDILENLKSLTD